VNEYTWSFGKDIEPLRGVVFAQSYSVTIHCRPLWQQRVIRVLAFFGVRIPAYTITVEVK
jgi:hypothetical protein